MFANRIDDSKSQKQNKEDLAGEKSMQIDHSTKSGFGSLDMHLDDKDSVISLKAQNKHTLPGHRLRQKSTYIA